MEDRLVSRKLARGGRSRTPERVEPSIAFWSYEERKNSEKMDEREADPALLSRSSSTLQGKGITNRDSTSGARGDNLLHWWCNFPSHSKKQVSHHFQRQ